MIRFDGQVAIVTGAGAGIGLETAMLLAERGASVLVNDPADAGARADSVVASIVDRGGTAAAEPSAVGDAGAAPAIVGKAIDVFGRIDILINNAAISRPAAFGEDSDEDIEKVFAVNLLGPYALMRAVWPLMRAQAYGRILNTASSAALGSGISGAYAPTKAGIIGLTKEAAMAGKAHGILVNALMPSAHTALLMNHPDAAFRKWIEDNFPARLVAATSAFLVSRELAATGEIFASRGGLVQRIAFHETKGIFDTALTPEAMRDNFDRIMAIEDGAVIASQADHGRIVNSLFPRSRAAHNPAG